MYSSIVSSLNARLLRVQRASLQTFGSELGSLVAFIRKTGPLAAIAKSIDDGAPGLDPAAWLATVEYGSANFPDNEPEYMKALQHLLTRLTTDVDVRVFGHNVFLENNYDDCCSRVATELVQSYVTYLQEQLGTESEILHLLARYRGRVEWFSRDELYAAYQADTRHGEHVYDHDLRKFLFEQGVDYPFSNPVSPSGRADVVALLNSTDPLVCEVKLYDPGASYGVPYVAKGFKQAHRYARDYGKTSGQLVVFNLSDETLELPNDHAGDVGPPSLSVSGVRVYLHVVQAKSLGPASERSKLRIRSISRADLAHEIEEPTE